MKILFVHKGDKNLGSNRIYISNLAKWVRPFVKEATISSSYKKGYDFYICSKYCTSKDLFTIKSKIRNSKIGIIHPNDSSKEDLKKLKIVDFGVVGSIEEKIYLQNLKKKIVRFPQIENYKLNLKKHRSKKKIILGYHGNFQNLAGSNQNYIKAIEILSRRHNLEFHSIYPFKLGIFKNKYIKYKNINWSEKNLKNFLKKIDIGIVPATNNFLFDTDNKKNIFLNIFKYLFSKFGRKTDYIIQFKYNANPGRSHLFHQAGIPTVAGFWPSHFEILSDEKNGYLAHSVSSWIIAIEKLIISHTLRKKISINAYKAHKRLYNSKIWTKKFINFLNDQKKDLNK